MLFRSLTNEELLRGVKTAWDKGWDKIKLYFMIGLPGETDADILGIAETLQWLRRETNHEVELNLIPALIPRCFHPSQEFFIGQTLINNVSHPLGACFRGKGETTLTSAA